MQRHFGGVLGLALVLAGCATVIPTTSFVQSWAALTMPSSEDGTYFGRDTSGHLQANSRFVRREV